MPTFGKAVSAGEGAAVIPAFEFLSLHQATLVGLAPDHGNFGWSTDLASGKNHRNPSARPIHHL
jgi:hypothetical protein